LFDDLPLSLLKKVIFMHDNAPAHPAKLTTEFLNTMGFTEDTIMKWPANSPDLNPIENLWAIIEQDIYANG
jgi:transposase